MNPDCFYCQVPTMYFGEDMGVLNLIEHNYYRCMNCYSYYSYLKNSPGSLSSLEFYTIYNEQYYRCFYFINHLAIEKIILPDNQPIPITRAHEVISSLLPRIKYNATKMFWQENMPCISPFNFAKKLKSILLFK